MLQVEPPPTYNYSVLTGVISLFNEGSAALPLSYYLSIRGHKKATSWSSLLEEALLGPASVQSISAQKRSMIMDTAEWPEFLWNNDHYLLNIQAET